MEENEIFEEINIDTVNENSDNTELVDSVEETQTAPEISQDELVDALLLLLNEQNNLVQEDNELVNEEIDSEIVPVLVQSVNEDIDYSDLLNSINSRLESLEQLTIEYNTPQSLDTPLNEYNIQNILLIGVLLLLGVSFGYTFIKDNLLHF